VRIRVAAGLRVEAGLRDGKCDAQHLGCVWLRRCAEGHERRSDEQQRRGKAPDDHSVFSMSPAIDSGVSFGAKRATTLPPRSTRNLVKFHLIASVPSNPGLALFKYR